MAPNPRRLNQRLDELYARLPPLECKQLCSDSCGPFVTSEHELARVQRAAGRPLEHSADCADCSMLTTDRRCSVYDIRPMICRLWGMTENMPCPYGCVPDGGRLSVEEGYAFLVEAFEIGGWPVGAKRFSNSEIRALLADPAKRRWLLAFQRPTVAGRDGALPKTIIERGYGT